MSFGFAIGDFIAVGKLAWTLYRECYQIARGAPQEFSLLVNELSTLSNSLTILQEEAKDPESTLSCAGDDRVRMVNEMIVGIEDTLNRLRKDKFKWSAEFSSIDRLRNKLIYHNTVINLLLTSVGNSSLQRIESSNAALTNDVRTIKNYIASNQAVIESKVPVLSAVDEDPMSTTLSANLMINAEAFQPWSTIGFDQWIGAGKWWLLRAQLDLHIIREPKHNVAPAAYANLIKAAWISVDLIPCHPQFPFISATKRSELQLLSTEVKHEFSRITALAMVVPSLDRLRNQDLRFWESIPTKAPILRPYKISQYLDAWRADGGENVLLRTFAFYEPDAVKCIPCVLLFLVHENAKAARLIAQDQYGDILKAISLAELWSPQESHIQLDCLREENCVMFGKEEFILNHIQDAQVLWNMVEATSFYVSGRRVDHASLEDLKAYMLLTAVKNRDEQAALQIRQEICKTDDILESDQRRNLAQLAVSMTTQLIEGQLYNSRDPRCCGPESSLFSWAVACNHTTLSEFLISEDPILDRSSEFWHSDPWDSSVTYENLVLLEWCIKHDTRRYRDINEYLCRAITRGNEKMVALLIDAGDIITENVKFDLLRSPLSEHVIHAILAMSYAFNTRSNKASLRKAAERGHEGAIVLLSYVNAMESAYPPGYRIHSAQASGHFEQLVAILAKAPNVLPAFGLTLLTVEPRRTQVLLKVVDIPPWLDTTVYLVSYHAFVEHISEGLSETHKKVVKIEMNGEFQITVVHQEKDLIFSVSEISSRFETASGACSCTHSLKIDTDEVSRPELLVEKFLW